MVGERHGRVMGMAWAWHATCESAFRLLFHTKAFSSVAHGSSLINDNSCCHDRRCHQSLDIIVEEDVLTLAFLHMTIYKIKIQINFLHNASHAQLFFLFIVVRR